MPLRHGRPYLAIPGPSVMPDRVLQAMHQPAPNIYTGALVDLVESVVPDLKTVARTKGSVAIYIANGHGAWEAAIANTCGRGDRILALVTGRFGFGWATMAQRLGVEVEILDFGKRAPVDPDQVEARLRADTGGAIKAVMVVHIDTSTSVRNDVPAVRAAMDAAGHGALLMVDCIASLACDRFEMDDWGVDVMVAGSQKGLMTPPGLGFVFFNEKAEAVRAGLDPVSMYWDWTPRGHPQEFYQYFGGTAPTHHLFALREALTMLVHEEGVEAALARHAVLARTIWAAVEAWGQGGPMEMNIADPACRAHAVTAIGLGAPNGTALRDWLSEVAGVTLGISLDMAPPGDPAVHGYFRIGHMGHVNAHMVLGLLGTIEAGLVALGVPHGKGALEAAAAVIARG
ncbi:MULTISPECIES: pyridoxal-phosphate-dependent aminotransferase family protein [Actibacterium]|jgi:alanine-glyoxylate transaminase / serine-glyoxylate transaminase / serine-pyruvate transaminase|uniref:Alanine-glyoxylate transaminase/serine-glyoxylate transaminase/serine-pyruvate transaminase n=1 Tax=Actibacterium naphthalenivorans TaxID=1614693 RepID=A0A840CDP5_9RHOB|nr:MULTISPECIES: aminotransferase class V-fold PLP-dependent enzyme [Actibacterium]ALG90809.1 septum site-determining protein [Actibacterium sp. EMB200-NS6]MBB4022973.1 alanine-glyoxylate transaminase/serine-glyoxylate transaminase/serine-pyruvate transaminase [Actibacterium naphthalenivorans]